MVTHTFVYAMKCGEDDDEERGGILPGVDEMRKTQTCVPVPAHTLRKTKPRRQRCDHGTYAITHTSAHAWT